MLKARYQQTVVGLGWAIIKPILFTLVMTFAFNRVANIQPQSDHVSYLALIFSAIIPWHIVSLVIEGSPDQFRSQGNMISAVYFPRLIFISSWLICCLSDVMIFVGFVLVFLALGIFPLTPTLCLFPIALVWTYLLSLGFSVWLAPLGILYQDIRHLIPFLMMIALYVSPIAYPSGLFPARWQWLLSLNPMVGLIDFCRLCLLGSAESFNPFLTIPVSLVITLIILLTGMRYLKHNEGELVGVL